MFQVNISILTKNSASTNNIKLPNCKIFNSCNIIITYRETLRKEGVVRGLYAGTVPSLAANVAENSILFAAYGLCQKLVARSLSVEVANLSTFSNGCAGKLDVKCEKFRKIENNTSKLSP